MSERYEMCECQWESVKALREVLQLARKYECS